MLYWKYVTVISLISLVNNTAFTYKNSPGDHHLNSIPLDKNTKIQSYNYLLSSEHKCKYKCIDSYEPHSNVNGPEGRFINLGTNSSLSDTEMEAPSPKISIFNLLTGDDKDEDGIDGDDDDDDDDDDDGDGYEKEDDVEDYGSGEELKGDAEDGDEDDPIDFFGYDEEDEEDPDKIKDEAEGSLKQHHRPGLRMQNLVFPLLLAYKLKFFTTIPLLLGSLVLLVGTTGIAGFFFALFAAALGIHVKSHHEH